MFVEQAHAASDFSQTKRRRFAPTSTPFIVTSDSEPLDFNSPSLLQLADRSPSQQEIEAQLLQVGMRIRKSVNDGYQNTPGRRAFTPRPFFNSNRLSPDTVSALSNNSNNDANCAAALSRQPISTATFCGVSLAVMAHISTATPIGEQKLWSYSTSSKRRQHFEEESDSDDSQEFMPETPQLDFADGNMAMPQDYFNIDFENMSDVSPMTQIGQPRPRIPGRKFAQPKSKVRSVAQEPLPFINPFVQIAAPKQSFSGHKRMTSCGMEAMMDFGEASFLQSRQDVEMDCS